MTHQPGTDIGLRSREAAPRRGLAAAPAAGALLAELEHSLETSQLALLSHDLEGLERATCEQIRLQRSLRVWRKNGDQSGEQRTDKNGVEEKDRAQTGDPTPLDSTLAAGLRAAAWRVLYLGRVQAALLTRFQRSLRIVSNRLAGPEASYAAACSNLACSNLAAIWPGWTPASRTSERPGNAAARETEKDEARKSDEKGAAPCRV